MDGQRPRSSRRRDIAAARENLTSSADMVRQAWDELRAGASDIASATSLEEAVDTARGLEFESDLLDQLRSRVPEERIEQIEEVAQRIPRRAPTTMPPPPGPRRGSRPRRPTVPEAPTMDDIQMPELFRKRIAFIGRVVAIVVTLLFIAGIAGLFFD